MTPIKEIRDLLTTAPLQNLRAMAHCLHQILADRQARDRAHPYDWHSLSSAQLEHLHRAILEALEARSS